MDFIKLTKNMNYLLTLLNIIIALIIWILPAWLFNSPGSMFVSWILALIIYCELDEARD